MYFAVIRERDDTWDRSRPMEQQDCWGEHATFMNSLVSEGFIILGGPLGDGVRILLMVSAESEEAVHKRFDADPWTPMRLLRLASVERWKILLGDSLKI